MKSSPPFPFLQTVQASFPSYGFRTSKLTCLHRLSTLYCLTAVLRINKSWFQLSLVKLWLKCIAYATVPLLIFQRVFTSQLIYLIFTRLVPFAVRLAFPISDYYGTSATANSFIVSAITLPPRLPVFHPAYPFGWGLGACFTPED